MSTPSLSTVDPVAIVIARIQANTALLAELGSVDASRVSGLNEGPYPHFRVTSNDIGDDGRLRWAINQQVDIELWGQLDGRPGSAELRRLLYLAVEDVVRMGDEIEAPGQIVVTDVVTIGTARSQTDRLTNQPCWAHTVAIQAHPAYV